MIREWLLRYAEAVIASRPPDFEIGPPGDRYMLRWHLCSWSNHEKGSKPKNFVEHIVRSLPAVYVHKIIHDDEDRALHDHPFSSCSFVLKNGYQEVLFYPISDARIARLRKIGEPRPTVKVFRTEGSITFRAAASAHRLVLDRDASGAPIHVVSLFLMGFRTREWGFYCPKRWVPWAEFVGVRDRGSVGRGCGED